MIFAKINTFQILVFFKRIIDKLIVMKTNIFQILVFYFIKLLAMWFYRSVVTNE